jgi:hypothetical protein
MIHPLPRRPAALAPTRFTPWHALGVLIFAASATFTVIGYVLAAYGVAKLW